MAKHTREPWHVSPSWGGGSYIGSENGYVPIETPFRENAGKMVEAFRAQATENAQHLVRCVNACAGINPEAVPLMVAALRLVLERGRADTHGFAAASRLQDAEDVSRAVRDALRAAHEPSHAEASEARSDWIEGLTYRCPECKRLCRASRDSVDMHRGEDACSDEEVVSTFELCLSCSSQEEIVGESEERWPTEAIARSE